MGDIKGYSQKNLGVTIKKRSEVSNNSINEKGINNSVEDMDFTVDIEYVVKPGNTMYQIAKEHGLDYKELAEYNNIADPSLINVGQVIRIPIDEKIEESSEENNSNSSELSDDYLVYTVQSGNTLSQIAEKYLNDASRYNEIAELNGITDPNNIYSGQQLRIPKMENKTVKVEKEVKNQNTAGTDQIKTVNFDSSEFEIQPRDHIDNTPNERERRIAYLTDGYSIENPPSSEHMESLMTTIEIPIWNGSEVTHRNLKVNKKLATDVEQIFQELADLNYEIEFSYELDGGKGNYEVEGYEYRDTGNGSRLSDHAFGGAIDVNAVHNPMTATNNNPLVNNDGSKYVVNEKVIEVFAKHGFYWGGDWHSSADPMHFTFTGY